MATAGAIGCNLGSIVAYWIGAWAGRPFVERFGKFVLVDVHDLDRATHFFEQVRIDYRADRPAAAGGSHFYRACRQASRGCPQLRFHIYTFVGSWPWCFVLAYVGMKLGEQWDTNPAFKEAFHRFHLAVEIVLLAGIVWFVWTHLLSRKRVSEA